jgi:hypothetical protein
MKDGPLPIARRGIFGSHRGGRTVNMSRHAALLICGKMLREPSITIPGQKGTEERFLHIIAHSTLILMDTSDH